MLWILYLPVFLVLSKLRVDLDFQSLIDLYFFMFISEDALYALKLSLNASPSQLTNWNKNLVDPCTWSNVECDQNNNVIRV